MSAVISECGRYRYRLDRSIDVVYGTPGRVVWVMLNPSTADATEDDPTIRRCRGFTKAWGYASFTVVNLFALRSTDPALLVNHPDPFGPENKKYIHAATESASLIVAAWGASYPKDLRWEIRKIAASLPDGVMCLGKTASGEPRHPLYVKGDTRLINMRA